jgi:hypothetical protein
MIYFHNPALHKCSVQISKFILMNTSLELFSLGPFALLSLKTSAKQKAELQIKFQMRGRSRLIFWRGRRNKFMRHPAAYNLPSKAIRLTPRALNLLRFMTGPNPPLLFCL